MKIVIIFQKGRMESSYIGKLLIKLTFQFKIGAGFTPPAHSSYHRQVLGCSNFSEAN